MQFRELVKYIVYVYIHEYRKNIDNSVTVVIYEYAYMYICCTITAARHLLRMPRRCQYVHNYYTHSARLLHPASIMPNNYRPGY